MTNENQLIKAFNEGYDAYQIGNSPTSNPYSSNSTLFKEWILGYNSAEIDKNDESEENEE